MKKQMYCLSCKKQTNCDGDIVRQNRRSRFAGKCSQCGKNVSVFVKAEPKAGGSSRVVAIKNISSGKRPAPKPKRELTEEEKRAKQEAKNKLIIERAINGKRFAEAEKKLKEFRADGTISASWAVTWRKKIPPIPKKSDIPELERQLKEAFKEYAAARASLIMVKDPYRKQRRQRNLIKAKNKHALIKFRLARRAEAK